MLDTDIGFIRAKKKKKIIRQFFYKSPKTPQNGHFWHKNGLQSKTNNSSNIKIDMCRVLDMPDVPEKLEKRF